MPTIYDVAKAAKTSPASVSRVLNGRQGVKSDVELRIKKAMETLAFVPRWKAMDRDRILVFVPDNERIFDSGYNARIMSGITDAAFSLGYGLQLRPCAFRGKDIEDLRQIYMRESVCGCILISMHQGYSLPRQLDLAGLPHVVIGHKGQDDGIHQILLNDMQAGRDATEFLLSLGHRRIAMVSFSHVDLGHLERYRGFEEVMMAQTHEKPVCIQCSDSTAEAGRAAARQLLSPRERPTAVIVTNEEIATGFQSEVKAMGLSLSKDVSMIAFEETDILSLLDVPITAMQTPAYNMGVEAVNMLFSLISAKPKQSGENLTKHLKISLVARYSAAVLAGS
jgi:LacI family transcriptional regulator